MNNHETTALLNSLIKTCRNGEFGFRSGARRVRSRQLATLLVFLSDNCQQAARELREHVVQLGGRPGSGRSVSGALHRAWLSVRSVFSANVDLAILRECKRGEDAAVAHYRRALEQPVPEALRALLERHYLGAKRNNERIGDLLVLEQVVRPVIERKRRNIARPSLRAKLEFDQTAH
jgi:uncharacterized protein (TIGR02284 family)